MRVTLNLCVASVLVLFFAGVLPAQEFTGNIVGRITDASGALLPGVTVTLKSPAIQGVHTAVTDETGNYRFILLPPGVFSVTYELPGFKTFVREDVIVQVGVTTTINVNMEVATVAETITVSGQSPVVDVQNSTLGVNFNQSLLRDIPNARDIWVVLAQTPGVVVTRSDVGGSTMGTQATYRSFGLQDQNWVNLDGIVTTEGTGAAGFYMDYGAFQEIQVSAAANAAEVPISGAFINTVVRTGGNDLRGEAYFDFEDQKFQGNNVTQSLRDRGVTQGDQFTRYHDFNANAGGPIIKDKFWWFFSFRDQFSGLKTELQQNDGTPGAIFTTRLGNETLKMNYQINRNNSLIFTGQAGRKFQPLRGGQGVNAQFFNVDSTGTQLSWSWAYKFQWTSVLSSKATMDISANTFGYHFPLVNHVNQTPVRDTGNNLVRGGYSGTGIGTTTTIPNRQQRRRWHFNGNLSYFLGEHNLKMGYGYIYEDQRYTNKSVPASPGALDGIVLYTINGVPDRFQIQNTPFKNQDALKQNFFFIQDKWQLTKRLTLNLGLRYDRFADFSPAQGNPGTGPWSFIFYPGTGKIQYPERSFPVFNNFVPRLALNYDLFGNTKTSLKASYGRYAENPGVTISSSANPNANTNVLTQRYRWDGRPASQITPDYVATLTPSETLGQALNVAVDPNLKNSYTDEYTAGISHEVMRDLGINFNFVRKFLKDPFERYNRAQPLDGFAPVSALDFGPDGIKGTADDRPFTIFERLVPANQDLILRTFKGTGANFTTFEVNATKRLTNRWQMLTGFDWTKRNLTQILRESNDPNNLLYSRSFGGTANQFGGNHTSIWTYKLNGTYEFPRQVFLHGTFSAAKGEAYGRTQNFGAPQLVGRTTPLAQGTLSGVYVEPEGAYYYPTGKLTNIRIEKKFQIRERHAVSTMFDLFNVFNANTITGVNTTTNTVTVNGQTVPQFGRVTQIVNPRIFRLGVRYMF